jgi:xanthine dehydrogenase accessory factor
VRRDSSYNVYENLLEELNNGKKTVIITKTGQGKSERYCLTEKALLDGENVLPGSLGYSLLEKAKEALETGSLNVLYSQEPGFTQVEPYFPEPKLIVLGGGHIALPLVEFAAKSGFKVTVVDDRLSFANSGRFPLAEKVICEGFERCFKLLNLNNSSFVVIVTRGHKHDLLCLKEALKYDTAYVGMIGSKRRVEIVNEQLLDVGYTKEQIQRVKAPIGLEINAVTPEEIAVSILAQVISCRRNRKSSWGNSSAKVKWPEFDRSVFEELAKGSKEPKAVATIISTKGSVPRKAGAKMLVYPDGRTLGSIGGGCSEGEVIAASHDIIKNGGYIIKKVDMTGYIAEEEGMVCGGIMEVLIEFCDL